MAKGKATVDEVCVNTIRTLAMDMVEAAKSGHPGAPMGLAPAGYVLFTRVLRHSPGNPGWPNRDRFVLSNGHASALLYSLLHLCGYDLPLDELKRFRQWGSRTPGHPEYRHTAGVETTTGPLGQGFGNAVGMAIAERHLAARFNRGAQRVVDHYTYVFCGDGDLMEGVSSEAASLAGHLGLGRLICLYDDNHISIDGGTELSFTEDVAKRFTAYGWQVLKIRDGNDLEGIRQAFMDARAEAAKPSLIVCRTHIAYGSPNKQDSHEAHGAPLGADEVRLSKVRLGAPPDETFFIPAAALRAFSHLRRARRKSRDRLAQDLCGLGAEAPCRGRGVAQRHGRRPAGRLGCRPAELRRRQADCHPCGLRPGPQRGRPPAAGADGRFGRPHPIQQHRHQGRARFPAGHARTGATCGSECASTPWAPCSTGLPCTAACAPTAGPSWCSRTTCARRSAWRRS